MTIIRCWFGFLTALINFRQPTTTTTARSLLSLLALAWVVLVWSFAPVSHAGTVGHKEEPAGIGGNLTGVAMDYTPPSDLDLNLVKDEGNAGLEHWEAQRAAWVAKVPDTFTPPSYPDSEAYEMRVITEYEEWAPFSSPVPLKKMIEILSDHDWQLRTYRPFGR